MWMQTIAVEVIKEKINIVNYCKLFYEYKMKRKLIQYYQQDIQVVIGLHWERNPRDQVAPEADH
jgi:hypothetical protein